MAQTIAAREADLDAAEAGGPVAQIRKSVGEWMFLAPALVFFIGYQVWPIVRVLWLSFTNFQFLSDKPAQWIWFDNYAQALKDPLMWMSLWRAALFTMMFLPGTIILPLLLAILVDRVVEPTAGHGLPGDPADSRGHSEHADLRAVEVDVQLSKRAN